MCNSNYLKSPNANFALPVQDYNATLEEIEKLLENFLENKRQAFPRFYFLPNDQLIQILSKVGLFKVLAS